MRTVWVLGAAAVFSGCSGNRIDRAPAADESCFVPPCALGLNTAGNPPGGSLDAGGTTTLAGTIGIYTDTAFSIESPFTGTGTIGVFGPAGPPNQASATFSGSTFTMANAPEASVVWADLQSTSTSVLPTLSAIDDTATGATGVAFVQASLMDQIFAELSHAPQSIRPDRAQLVVEFVSSTGLPLAGATITVAPQGADVAYDSGANYADAPQFAVTGARGMALVLNATAVAWPGALAALTFKYGTPSVTATFNAYIAQGAVTVVTIAVSA